MGVEAVGAAFRDKTIMVTGGTGSFGRQIVRQLLQFAPRAVHVLSRDEKKQHDMRFEFREHANLHFVLGDVRDLERLHTAFVGMDVVFHAAALKQVPSCESAPSEAYATNVLGAFNVRQAALKTNVGAVVAISTDKAVKPVNVMGMTKALQERIILQRGPIVPPTRFVCVRYGNVVGSRGSVIPLFHRQILEGVPVTITHPEMTRFVLTLKEAVQLVLQSVLEAQTGDLWVRKMPAVTVAQLARVMTEGLSDRGDYPIETVGVRAGEKMHEVLVSEEEMWRAQELGDYFRIPSWDEEHSVLGPREGVLAEYSSSGVRRLSDDELHALLESEGWFVRSRRPD